MIPDIVFSERVRELQARARRVADQHVRPSAAEHDRLQQVDRGALRAAAEAGLLGVVAPEELGGCGGGTLALCAIAEELSRADPGFGVVYGANALGALPLRLAGTAEQQRRWLPGIARGEALTAFCVSEKGAGSDLGALAATAERDGDSYVLHGEKKWTTNAGAADLYTVLCVTDARSRSRRLSAFLVDRDAPGLRVAKVEDLTGIRSAPVGEVHLDRVRVPTASLLGGEGEGYEIAMKALDLARPCTAAQAVGLAQGALDLALVYATRRRQFGRPIASFQLVQKMLADMASRVEAARWLTYAAAARADAGEASARKLAAMSKCFASDIAMEVATDAVQIFGGYGFTEDYPIARFYRDAKIFQIFEGTNQIQRLIVASSLVKEVERLAHLDELIPREEQRSYRDDEPPEDPGGDPSGAATDGNGQVP